MTWRSKAAEGFPLVNNPNWRSRRTATSFWVTFSHTGRARIDQGAVPETGHPGLPHGPFPTRAAAKKYVREL